MARSGMVWQGLAFNFKNIVAWCGLLRTGETRQGFIFKTKGLGSVWYGRVWHGYFFKNIMARCGSV
jgi:hypothetical protein